MSERKSRGVLRIRPQINRVGSANVHILYGCGGHVAVLLLGGALLCPSMHRLCKSSSFLLVALVAGPQLVSSFHDLIITSLQEALPHDVLRTPRVCGETID